MIGEDERMSQLAHADAQIEKEETRMSAIEDAAYSVLQAGQGLYEATNGDDAYSYKEDLEKANKKLQALLTEANK